MVLPRNSASLVYAATGLHLVSGLALWTWWQHSGDFSLVRWWFDFAGALFLLTAHACALLLSLAARACFDPGEPLRLTWTLIAGAAALRLTGDFIAHVLAVPGGWRRLLPVLQDPPASTRELGLTIGGAGQMLLLVFAFAMVLRLYRASGFRVRVGLAGQVITAAAVTHTLATSAVVLWAIVNENKRMGALELASWTADPLSCLLIWQALKLRAATLSMGGGLVARCWGAYAAAVMLVTAGELFIWLGMYQLAPYPVVSLGWYVWYPAASAHVLGPLYQLRAITLAAHPVGSPAAREP